MKDFMRISRSKAYGLLELAKKYQLVVACIVIVLCFAIGNDIYAAKTVAQRHKDLMNGPRRVFDMSEAMKKRAFDQTFRGNNRQAYLVDPKTGNQKSLLSVLAGSDTCGPTSITSLPFSDTSTTVGAVDDYDMSGDPTGCPTCVGTSGNFPDRGYTYLGTGTGPDTAYKIRFKGDTNLQILLDPLDSDPDADDLNVVFYTNICSSNPADAIIIADNSGSGNSPDLPDNTEFITITNLPAGTYNIVVDAYTQSGAPTPTQGAYKLDVTCAPSMTCLQPVSGVARQPRS